VDATKITDMDNVAGFLGFLPVVVVGGGKVREIDDQEAIEKLVREHAGDFLKRSQTEGHFVLIPADEFHDKFEAVG